MTKFTILLKRHPAMTHAEFVEYHKHTHAPLFSSLPVVRAQVRRYVQQHTLPVEMPGLPPAKYDGITELWFDDAAGIAAVFGDPEYFARIRPDEERFLDLHGCDFVVSQENPVFQFAPEFHMNFTMTDAEYRACAAGHHAMGTVGGARRLGLINV